MRTRAIIIKKQNTNEYDQLITCYTQEFGKLTAIAKSILKNNSIQAMHLDLFNLVDFELVAGRAISIITGAQAENSFSGMKQSPRSLALAFVFAEYLDKYVYDFQKDDRLWDFISSAFAYIGSQEPEGNWFRKKQIELLGLMGYTPNLNKCVTCVSDRKSDYVVFNPDVGGLLCENCFLKGGTGIFINQEDLNILRGLESQHNTRSAIDSIFEYILNKKLNSIDLFYSELSR